VYNIYIYIFINDGRRKEEEEGGAGREKNELIKL
jgi:hypothetical protein